MPPVMATTRARPPLAGLIQVKNHGFPAEVVEKTVNVGRKFFNLPESERLKNYSDVPLKTTRLSTSFKLSRNGRSDSDRTLPVMAAANGKPCWRKRYSLLCDLAAIVNRVPANFIRPFTDRPNLEDVIQLSDDSILLIDLQDLNGPNRLHVIQKIGQACQDYDFFQVNDHGVPDEVVEKMVNVGREFFNLPGSERLRNYSDDPLKTTRLSTSFNVKTEEVPPLRDYLRLHCHPLVEWPTNPPSFRFLPRGVVQPLPAANFCGKTSRPEYDVFINHRGIDTKRNFAGLLYDNLRRLRIRTFLDRMSLKLGDRLFDAIDEAILGCKVGVVVFSPRYCESYSCLHELALLVESGKRLVPIFYDVQRSQLQVRDDGTWPAKELPRFSWAIKQTRNTFGLKFDSSTGDWSELLRNASDAVIMNLVEAEKGAKHQ